MTIEPQEHGDEADLARLLRNSAPQTPAADTVPASALHEIVRGSRWETKRSRRHHVTPRSVAIGTVLLLTLGGAGAAAAATVSGWDPWVQNPDATVHFTLPSGTSCEYRLVVNAGGNPADYIAAQDYVKSTDVLALADIDGELARATARMVGTQEDTAVPASTVYSKDQLYYDAVTGAITNVIWDEMEARGVVSAVTGSDLSLKSQSDCAGEMW